MGYDVTRFQGDVDEDLICPICSGVLEEPVQGFSVTLEAVLELALVDQAGLELTEIHLPLPPKCWA